MSKKSFSAAAEAATQALLNAQRVDASVYCLISPLVFSLAPRSHEWYGLQK